MGFSSAEAHNHYDKSLLALDEIRTSKPSVFLEKLYKLESKKYIEGDALYLNYLYGYASALKGDFNNATALYQKVINSKGDSHLTLKASVSLANLYAITANYTSSLSLLTEVLPMIEKEPDLQSKFHALLGGAIIYNEVGQFELANSLIIKAEGLGLKKVGSREYCLKKAIEVQSLSKLSKGLGNLNEIEQYIERCDKKGEAIYANIIRFYYTNELIKNSELESAKSILTSNIDNVKETNYASLITVFYSQLAEINKIQNQNIKSKEYATKAIESQAIDTSSEEWILNSYKLLYEINKEQGLMNEALYFLEKHSHAERAYTNKVTAKQLAFQLVSHATEEKNRQIELLNKRNKLLNLEQDLAKQSENNNKLMILLLITILASLAFWAYRVKRNQIEFKRRSETDALTGVSSRHHFYSACRQVLKDAEKREIEVSLILFDMDRFKTVNDKYGHLVGDWVLQKAIEVCRPCWRQNDIAGRLGGEEFALMLPTCDLDKAVEIAENCRKAIEKVDTIESGHKFHISASFGVTTSKISGYGFSKLIGDSDKIMYQAKAAGKNQVLRVAKKS